MGFYIQNHMMEKRRYYWAKCRVHFERSNGRICCSETARGGTCDLVWVLVYDIGVITNQERIIWV
jgi:hypothetical protein